MNGYYIFAGAFAALGLYQIIVSAIRLARIDRAAEGAAEERSLQIRRIIGGLLLIGIGVMVCFRSTRMRDW